MTSTHTQHTHTEQHWGDEILGSIIVLQSSVIESAHTYIHTHTHTRHSGSIIHLWPIKHFNLCNYTLTKDLPCSQRRSIHFHRCLCAVLSPLLRLAPVGTVMSPSICSAPRCLPYYLENVKNKVWHWSVIHFESCGNDWWISRIWSTRPEWNTTTWSSPFCQSWLSASCLKGPVCMF